MWPQGRTLIIPGGPDPDPAEKNTLVNRDLVIEYIPTYISYISNKHYMDLVPFPVLDHVATYTIWNLEFSNLFIFGFI